MRSIQQAVAQRFGEQRISRRMNPDEAVGFGLGWMGAIRSSKYKIPYVIQTTDLLQNLSVPLTLHFFGEDGAQVFENPLQLFKNGDSFPNVRKVTLRFKPGKYTVRLQEGALVHEESAFEVAPKNLAQFTDREAAVAAGVDFEDPQVRVVVRVQADQDGCFRLYGLARQEHELQFNDVKRKVPNEKYDEQVKAREEAIAQAKADFDAKSQKYAEDRKAYDEALKAYAEREAAFRGDAANKDKQFEEPRPVEPVKPAQAPAPAEVPRELEVTEKEPKIVLMNAEVRFAVASALYNVSARAQQLREFEMRCQKVDAASLEFDAAVNELETIIYQTRDGIDYALREFLREDEVPRIRALLDEAQEFAQQIEGKQDAQRVREKAKALREQLAEYYERKQSHTDAEYQYGQLKKDARALAKKYRGTADNDALVAEVERRADEAYDRLGALDKKTKVADAFGADLKWLAEKEKQMEENVKKAAEAAKKAEEEAKKAAKEKEKEAESSTKDAQSSANATPAK